MKILFKQCSNLEQIEKANSIADAIRYSGHDSGFNNMAILDAFYEYRPDIYVTHEETTEEEKFACEKYSVEIAALDKSPYANIFRFKKINPLKELIAEQICINDYEDHLSLMDYIDKRNPKKFRIFQRKLLGFDCYCGYVSHEYQSLLLSSAKEVVCNNLQSYYNHLLSNENCVLTKNLIKNTTCQDAVLEHSTCFHAAYDLIGDDALIGLEKYTCK